MRVIAGKYKGRVLKGPKHEGVRPTADRVKEALFNILGARIMNADLLDLFAGTGAIGIEALSRGAKSVVFADSNRLSIKLLTENLKILNSEDRFRVLHAPVERNIHVLAGQQLSFDLIFLDPPFGEGLLPKTVKGIMHHGLLKEDGILIVEHPRKLVIDYPGLINFLTRNYGDISLSFFENTRLVGVQHDIQICKSDLPGQF
jgi:16S rRNA (guanine(966)-N(2))-methyltransferase RsmD